MDTRRFILAVALSFFVIVTYMHYFGPKPAQRQAAPEKESAPLQEKKPAAIARPEMIAEKIKTVAKGEDIIVETDLFRSVINTAGGVIKSYELKKYKEADKEVVGFTVFVKRILKGEKKPEKEKKAPGNVQLLPFYEGVDIKEMTLPLTLTPDDASLAKLANVEYHPSHQRISLSSSNPTQTLTLIYAGPGGIRVEKKLTFYNGEYKVDVGVSTEGLEGYRLSLGTDFGMSNKLDTSAGVRVGFVSQIEGKLVSEVLDNIKGETRHSGSIAWFGNEDKYFTAVLTYGGTGFVSAKKTAAPKEIGDLLNTEIVIKQATGAQKYTLYAGPKNYDILKSFGNGMEQMINYGWFTILAKPMFWLMKMFFGFTGNYGIAIILLTIVVRLILFYPSLKSARSMEEMKSLQPEMTALREKYKKDPQRMNQEIMKLYKEKKVNPMGGCLPMLMQIPFFIALYNVLSVSIELRQSPFISFWIKDLSVYDPFYILPVLMGLSMIVTMKMTSTTADPTQAKMFMLMNIMFIFLFAWLPAGLLLYITLSNLLSIVQQLYVRRLLGPAKA